MLLFSPLQTWNHNVVTLLEFNKKGQRWRIKSYLENLNRHEKNIIMFIRGKCLTWTSLEDLSRCEKIIYVHQGNKNLNIIRDL
jgi:hypothetical protein